MGKAKVFGIGLNKTGTRSLAVALRQLGYRTLHKGDEATSGMVERAGCEGRPLLTHIGHQYDAYFDVRAIVGAYRHLDREYPGSRFLLSTRPLDAWLDSRTRHVQANQDRHAQGKYDGVWLSLDPDGWRDEYDRHHAEVRDYFQGSDRLLEIDVTSGTGWPQLCGFLGRPVPATPFPWENKNGAGTYA